MKKRSFSIALSAVSCAIATVFMMIGQVVPFAFASGYLFAAVALMLPLAKDLRLGGFLAFAATALICLPMGLREFYKFFPFIAFFGLHPLVNSFQQKWKVNRWLAYAVKAVWFVGAMCAAWAIFVATATGPNELVERLGGWIYLAICIGGALFFLLYDWLMLRLQRLVNYYVSKIDRSGRRSAPPPPPPEGDDDVFGEDFAAPQEEQREKDDDGKGTGQ